MKPRPLHYARAERPAAPDLAILRQHALQPERFAHALGDLRALAVVAIERDGEVLEELRSVSESVALLRGLKADTSLAEVLITLGKIVRAQGEAAAAYGALTEALRLALAVGPRLMVTAALEGLASLAAEQTQAELTVRLLAAAATLHMQMSASVRPADQATVDSALATARSTLGDEAFAAVWAEAQALPLEQILNAILSAASFGASSSILTTQQSAPPAA
jgi:hypothetical protein